MRARCPLCGHGFETGESLACGSCPMARGCKAICCPSCSYSWVEPRHSPVGRWLARWLRYAEDAGPADARSLADVPPLRRARILSCGDLPHHGRRRLRAYGLADGGVVTVLQQSSATLIVLDHVEIALETDLARSILVEIIEGEGTERHPERHRSPTG